MNVMTPEEQFDVDMLTAIRTVARHASGRPDAQDPDVVLARAREAIHNQRRRIKEVERLYDRSQQEKQRSEEQVQGLQKMVEDLRKTVEELRKFLDGHRAQNIALSEKCDALEAEKKNIEAKLAHATSPVPNVVEGAFPYTIADVDLIEKHRGHAYPRLRSTVEALNRNQKRIETALEVIRRPVSERKWVDADQALDPTIF